jgi:hypothetical protein
MTTSRKHHTPPERKTCSSTGPKIHAEGVVIKQESYLQGKSVEGAIGKSRKDEKCNEYTNKAKNSSKN